MGNTVEKIYLHWSGTSYNWNEKGHYHTVITGDGVAHHLTPYHTSLSQHTYERNHNSIAIALACMGGDGWISFPPTKKQIEMMCAEVAAIIKQLKWPIEKIDIKHVLTHAEAAANRDYPIEIAKKVSEWSLPISLPQEREYRRIANSYGLPHENYGPLDWFDDWPTGFCERWDLWQLTPKDPGGKGGFILRDKIRWYFKNSK